MRRQPLHSSSHPLPPALSEIHVKTPKGFGPIARTQIMIHFLALKEIFTLYWVKYAYITLSSAVSFALNVLGMAMMAKFHNSGFSAPHEGFDQYLNALSQNEKLLVLLASLISSTLLTFHSKAVCVQMMIAYERLCANRIFKEFQKTPEKKNTTNIMRLMSKDCRFAGRIVGELSNLTMPLGILLVAIPILFYISKLLTLVLLCLAIVSFVPFIAIRRKACSTAHDFELAASEDAQYKKKALSRTIKADTQSTEFSFPTDAFAHSYERRLMIPHYGNMIGGLQLAFLLSVLAWSFASKKVFTGTLAELLIYGAIAFFALRQVSLIAKVFANVNVFFVYFRRAFLIIHGWENFEKIPIKTKNEATASYDIDLFD
jgi:ABC-type multidrug transport system fused ATPase/permease subunit